MAGTKQRPHHAKGDGGDYRRRDDEAHGHRFWRVVAIAVTVLAVLTGCGSESEPDDDSARITTPASDTTPSTGTDASGQMPSGCSLADALAGRCQLTRSQSSSASSKLTQMPRGQTTGVIPTFTHQPGTVTMEGYLTTVVNNLARYWTAVYRGNSFTGFSSVHYRWIREGESFQMGCVDRNGQREVADADTAASYCGADDTMYLGVPLMIRDWNGWTDPGGDPKPRLGEFGIVWSVAHEFGHNIQHEANADHSQISDINYELEADCLAGVYMKGALNLSNQLNEQGVTEVIVTSLHFGGGDHGEPLERMLATLTGLNYASPKRCAIEYEKL
jgi:hypothetical protein